MKTLSQTEIRQVSAGELSPEHTILLATATCSLVSWGITYYVLGVEEPGLQMIGAFYGAFVFVAGLQTYVDSVTRRAR